jgi:hypothetical protein
MISVIYDGNGKPDSEELFDATQVDTHDLNFLILNKKVGNKVRLVAMVNKREIKRLKTISEVAKCGERKNARK